jgi:serine/threonine-protein kinase HipA
MLARNIGLPTAESRVMHFQDEIAIVIERYDRLQVGNDIVRVHQEDICQARGIMPTQKYQNEGGPGAIDVVELLRSSSTDREADVQTFVAALGFNWIIGGSDAHAKNYSLLLGSGTIRLAPLYDVASVFPYDEFDVRRIKLAMKIGGEYKLAQIGLRQWQKFAREVKIDAAGLIDLLIAMASQIPDEVSAACARARDEGLKNALIDRLAERLVARAADCLRVLQA